MTLPTLEERRAAWIAALRSGKYEQGRKYLCKDGKYCCLGVACEVAIELGLELEVTRDKFGTIIYGRGATYAPTGVVEFFGIIGDLGCNKTPDVDRELGILNDNGTTFSEIADLLETGEYWA